MSNRIILIGLINYRNGLYSYFKSLFIYHTKSPILKVAMMLVNIRSRTETVHDGRRASITVKRFVVTRYYRSQHPE